MRVDRHREIVEVIDGLAGNPMILTPQRGAEGATGLKIEIDSSLGSIPVSKLVGHEVIPGAGTVQISGYGAVVEAFRKAGLVAPIVDREPVDYSFVFNGADHDHRTGRSTVFFDDASAGRV